jgi:hypothetical protein
MPRKPYTAEFKREAVRMMTEQGLSVPDVSKNSASPKTNSTPGGNKLASKEPRPSPAPVTSLGSRPS